MEALNDNLSLEEMKDYWAQREQLLENAMDSYYIQRRQNSSRLQAVMFAVRMHWPEWKELLLRFDPKTGHYAGWDHLARHLEQRCKRNRPKRPKIPSTDAERPPLVEADYRRQLINTVIGTALRVADRFEKPQYRLPESMGEVAHRTQNILYWKGLDSLKVKMVSDILARGCTEEERRYFYRTCSVFKEVVDRKVCWERIGWPMVLEELYGESKGYRTFEELTRVIEKKVGRAWTIQPLATDYILPEQLIELRRFYPTLLPEKDRGRKLTNDERDGA